MAGQDVGTVYVQVVPSGKDFGRTVEGSISESAAKASKTGSNSLITGFTGAFSKIGKIGLGAITAVGGGITALAAKGGFERALNIENARAKLTGLGHDANSVNSIMKNALDSVKGTAFGLGDAATVAASLSAAGVPAGEQLTNVLKTVADTAQISGRSLTDIGTIFGSVAARGKLQGDDMLQLMSSGVPVLQMLAKHLGKTSAEVSDMVSKGKIDFQTFADAMQEGMGGAALKAGDTFSGALANAKAALSRLGESAATPAMESLRKILLVITPVIDQLSGKLTQLIDKTVKQAGPLVDQLISKINQLSKGLQDGSITISDIAQQLGLLTGGFAALAGLKFSPDILSGLSGVAGVLDGQMSKVGSTLGALPTKITDTVTHAKNSVKNLKAVFNTDLRDALDMKNPLERFSAGIQDLNKEFGKPFRAIGEKLSNTKLGQQIGALASQVSTGFANLSSAVTTHVQLFGGKLGSAFSNVGSKIANSKIGNIFGGLSDMISPKLQAGLEKIGGIFGKFFSPANFLKYMGIAGIVAALVVGLGMINDAVGGQILVMVNNMFAGLPALLNQAIAWIQSTLPTIMFQGTQILASLMQGIADNAPQLMTTAVTIITALINGLAEQLPLLVPIALNMIVSLVGGLLGNIGEIINAGMNLLLGLVQGVMNALPNLIAQAPVIIGNMANSIASNLPQILSTGVQILVTLATGLASAIPQLLGMIPGIISRIWKAFTSVNWGSIGMNIITGIASGIAKAAGNLVSAAVDAAKNAVEKVKGWLGINSPSRRARDEIGKWIPAGMAVGITATSGQVTEASMQVADQALNPLRKLPNQYQNLLNDATRNLTMNKLKQDILFAGTGYNTTPHNQPAHNNEQLQTLNRIAGLLEHQESTIVIDGRELGRAVQRHAIA